MPASNLILVEMSDQGDAFEFSKPKFLTDFNKNGYNNQPSFIDYNHILFTSNYQAEGPTDIYQLSLADERLMRMTATKEGEYSPMARGKYFTVVRQEQTESSNIPQTLWRYPLDRSDAGRRAVPKYDNIGYYQWLPGERVAMFLLGDPMYMEIYDVDDDQKAFVTNNPGRSFQYDGQYLYYIVNAGETSTIRRMNVATGGSEYVTRLVDGSQDYVLGDDYLITGAEDKLYIYRLTSGARWEEVLDLSEYGIKDISRLALSGDRLVMVIH